MQRSVTEMRKSRMGRPRVSARGLSALEGEGSGRTAALAVDYSILCAMSIVTLTEAAAVKARELLEKTESPADALRVRVIDGGCSGMRYELLFDGETGETDSVFEQHGLRVVVDGESATFLADTTIDFVDDLNESGFKIENPNASTTCGCGESFAV